MKNLIISHRTEFHKFKRQKKSALGFGLIEVVFAAMLIMIISIVVSRSLTGHVKTNTTVVARSACNETIQLTIDTINSLGTQDTVLPTFFPDRPAFINWVPASVYDPYAGDYNTLLANSYKTLLPTWFAANTETRIAQNDVATGVRLQLSSLIANSVNLIQNLYNSQRATVCVGSGLSIKNLLVQGSSNGSLTDIQNVILKIYPFDLSSQTVIPNCPANMIAAPPKKSPKVTTGIGNPTNNYVTDGFKIVGDSDLGFKIDVTAVPTSRGDSPIGPCSSQAIVKFGADAAVAGSVALKPGSPSTVLNVPFIFNAVGNYWNLAGAADVRLAFTAVGVESGSSFLCRDLNEIPKRYKTCDTLILAPAEGGAPISPAALNYNSVTGDLNLEFNGLTANNTYRFALLYVDSAGNFQPEVQIIFQTGAGGPQPCHAAGWGQDKCSRQNGPWCAEPVCCSGCMTDDAAPLTADPGTCTLAPYLTWRRQECL